MKPSSLFAPVFVLALGAAVSASAQPERVEPPVPVVQGPPPPLVSAPSAGDEYQQRHYGQTGPLIAPDKANQVVQAFRTAYDKLGKPRILFYVNRDLVDDHSGMKLTGRHEKTETTVGERKSSFEADANAAKSNGTTPQTQVNVAVGGGSAGSGHESAPGKGSSESRTTTVTGENTYAAGDKAAPSLADKLTTREVETLFGRPFRVAGASLADQKVAASLIADQPIDHFTTATNDSARKDREALSKVADVVIEILVSSRNATLTAVSGDSTVAVPDIQVTAIRLSDSAIVGQASSTDVLGKDRDAARLVRQFGVREITEATALALMEDMTTAAAK